MRVLVTGGAGYIGSVTARALGEDGHEVILLDRRRADHVAPVVGAEAVRGDVGDGELLASLFAARRFDAVVHLAADKSVEASLSDAGGYFSNNVGATLTLLRCMVEAGVDRFVFSSTCALYAPTSVPPLTEESGIDPQSPYGASKLTVEQLLPWFDRAHGLRSVSLRYFNAAGASDDARLGEDWNGAVNLVPLVMRAAAGHLAEVIVNGRDYPTPDGTALRDYIHVVDVAAAHVAALAYLDGGAATTILNVGTGQAASVLEVVHAVERASGRSVPIAYGPRRPGDLPAVWADTSLAARVLGWRSTRDIDDIARSAWQWHTGVRATPAGA